MVLEGVVVAVLNKFLGPYVKNLDASQLKVAVWSGEVQLESLELKESALSQFDIPFRIFRGQLGKLKMSIPWKSLYTEPVVIEVDGLYIVAGPETAVKYDPGKEIKEERERKQRKLKEIEEARKKDATINDGNPVKDPGFVEKLIAQIIQNVQLSVKNIHICYEDKASSKTPFTCGITLDSLLLKSTNGKWEIVEAPPTNAEGGAPIIFKLVQLNCFSVYWNSSNIVTDDLSGWKEKLKAKISRSRSAPSKSVDFIISPLSAVARLQLTTSRRDDNTPMLSADLTVHDIDLSLSKRQYHDVLSLVDSADRMVTGRKYRKYRPSVVLSANRKAWWQFAYRSILEENVKRRLYMWSWKRMKKHRSLCKEYVKHYTEKLVNDQIPPHVAAKIEDIEDELDIFNITISRQLAENAAQKQIKQKIEAQKNAGWFGGWFGGGTSSVIPQQDQLSPEEVTKEKDKLYKAIGYSESGKAASYPKEYVAHKVNFQLKKVAIKFTDDSLVVGKLVTTAVSLNASNRPAAKNISVQASVQHFEMSGTELQNQDIPYLISTEARQSAGGEKTGSNPLLMLGFELNPLNSKCNQRIKLSLLPVKVVYNAPTIDRLLDMFIPPAPVKLQTMSSSVSATLESLRTQTRAGLEHAINERKILDIDITLNSPIVYIPENGVLTSTSSTSSSSSVLIINLGKLAVKSDMKHHIPDVREAADEELMEAFYDHLNLSIENVQLAFKKGGMESAILDPIQFSVGIHKSLLPNDTKLPGVKIDGDLPLVSVNVSDELLKDLLKLFQSLPLPPPALSNRKSRVEDKFSDIVIVDQQVKTDSLLKISQTIDTTTSGATPSSAKDSGSPVASDSDSDGDFITASEGEDEEEVVKVQKKKKKISSRDDGSSGSGDVLSTTKVSIRLNLSSVRVKMKSGMEDLFDISLSMLILSVDVKSWETFVQASIDSLSIYDHYQLPTDPVPLLVSDKTSSFIRTTLVLANRDAPHYNTKYKKTEKKLSLSMNMMSVILRQETVCFVLQLMDEFRSLLQTSAKSDDIPNEEKQPLEGQQINKAEKSATPIRVPIEGEILMSVSIELAGAELTVENRDQGKLVHSNVSDIGLLLNKTIDETTIKASVGGMALNDPVREDASEQLIKVVYCEGQCLNAELTLYEDSADDIDMKMGVAIGRVKVLARLQLVAKILVFVRALKISQESIEKAKSTAKEAASATVNKVKEREQSNKRIKIGLSIEAPDVTIPTANPDSSLTAQLGSLQISNSFTSDNSLSFETFNIRMSSIQLYEQEEGTTDQFLRPFDMTLTAKRNLSSSYDQHPMIGIGLDLSPLELLISEKDTRLLSEIVDYNMKLLPLLSGPAVDNADTDEDAKSLPDSTSTQQGDKTKEDETTKKESEEKLMSDDYNLLGINVSLKKVGLILFRSKTGHEESNEVTSIKAEGIQFSGGVSAQSIVSFSFRVDGASIGDIRANSVAKFKNVLTKLGDSDSPLLVVEGNQDASQQIVNVEVVQPELSFNIPFVLYLLLTVKEIASPFSKGEKVEKKLDKPVKPVEKPSKPDPTIDNKTSTDTASPGNERVRRIVVKISEPRLLLVSIKDDESADSLIVECSLNYSLTSEFGQVNMFAGVNGVRINCILAENVSQPVLLPSDISATFAMPGGTKKNISLSMGQVQLCITPSIVRVILKVLSELKPKEDEVFIGPTAPDGLWKPEPIDYSKWYLQPLVEEKSVLSLLLAEEGEGKSVAVEETDSKGEFLSVDIQQVSILVYLEDPTSGQLSTGFSILVGCYGSHGLKIFVEDWSGNLKADASLCVVMSAYNTISDNWEPVLEPLVEEKDGDVKYHPWTLQMIASKLDPETSSATYAVSLTSDNALQLTVTKSSISSVLALSKSYQLTNTLAATPQSITDVQFRNTTIVFDNQLGPSYAIQLIPKEFVQTEASQVNLNPGGKVELVKEDNSRSFVPGEIIPPSKQQQPVVNVSVMGFRSYDILIKSSGSKYYPLIPKRGSEVLGMVIDVERSTASSPTVVTFRSPLRIKNHLGVSLKVFWTPPKSKEMQPYKTVKPKQLSFLPVNIAHSGSLHFQPIISSAKPSTEGVSWRNIGSNGIGVECSPVFIHVSLETEKYLDRLPFSLADRPHHTLHINYTVIVHNHLPHQYIQIGSNDFIAPGDVVRLYKCNPNKKYEAQMIVKDPEREYHGKLRIGQETEESLMTVKSNDGIEEEMEISIHRVLKGSMEISLYSKCIIANKTGFDLEYSTKDFWGKRKVIQHSKDLDYLLFSGSEIYVRIIGDNETDWSEKFCVDAIGNEGVLTCKMKNNEVEVQLGCIVQLSHLSLSKIVSITPFYMLANNTRDPITVLEYSQPVDNAIIIEPSQIIPFWPIDANRFILVDIDNKGDGLSTFSKPFNYSENGEYFLKLSSNICGLSVHVQITPSAGLISFNPYYDGAIPVRLINTMDYPIMFGQSRKNEDEDLEMIHMLMADQSLFYTWDNPNGVRQLRWGVATGEGEVHYQQLKLKDGHGVVHLGKKKEKSLTSSLRGVSKMKDVVKKGVIGSSTQEGQEEKCYWVCLSDSFQRIILFSSDSSISKRANDTQVVKMMAEISLSIKALSLSLVNDLKRTEVCFIGLTQSEAIWEKKLIADNNGVKQNEKYKPVEVALGVIVESLHERKESKSTVPIPDSDITLDFSDRNNVKLRKDFQIFVLKRSYYDGFSVLIGYSSTVKSISLKVNKLQIDNHLRFALHPTIFYCYPPPPSLATVVVPKPFFETSLVIRTNEGAGNNEIQYLQVLIQEMGFILDIEFLLEVLTLVELKKEDVSNAVLLTRDLDMIKKIDKSDIEHITSKSEKMNFKFVHLSSIDVHVSFSLDLAEEKKEEMLFYADSNILLKNFLDFFHALFGLIGQAKDAELKLGYFELQEKVLNKEAIIGRIIKHYKQQFLYQLYSVVLGLEVLGNPVGFVRGLTEGTIGLFYQPIQGAVLGPEEFIQGLALGTHQFIGGTFGGIAGIGAKVTGVFGDVVAKLTFDEDFKERRKRQQTSFGQGVESLTKGVFHGVTGIVSQPISGAQKEGVLGFFKGASKGVLGLVLRPAGGLIDFTSATLTAVQKKTQVGDFELAQMRPSRYIALDKVVYPYSANLAEGYAVFLSYDEGKLYGNDTYLGYIELSSEPVLKVLLVTDNRLMVLKQGGTFVTKWEDEFIIKFKTMKSESQLKTVSSSDSKRTSGSSSAVFVNVIEEESWFGGLVGAHGGKKDPTPKKVSGIPSSSAKQATVLINRGFTMNKKKEMLIF